MEILQAVIPAAGHGTRFLPFTKAVPKEMLPLLNKPAIHYIVEEIYKSGVKQCIFITAPHKQAIANYFGSSPELEQFLEQKNKLDLLSELKHLTSNVRFSYVNQLYATGLGSAVNLSKEMITQPFFAVLLPDDIIHADQPGIAQLMHIALQQNASVIAIQEVPEHALSSYGIIAVEQQISDNLFQIKGLVEKPKIADAPSNLAIIGRYILSNKIFAELDKLGPTINGEVYLTEGISNLLAKDHKVFAYKIQGTRFDLGIPAGWLHANMTLASGNPVYKSLFS